MTDLISRQSAIKMCREPRMRNADCSDFEMEIMMLPSARPERKEEGWIPMTERVPEKNGRYLVTNSAWGAFMVDWNIWVNGEWLYPNSATVA